jgi:hypothetical protein
MAAAVSAMLVRSSSAQSNEATKIAAEWLGPHPLDGAEVHVRPLLWQGPGAMVVEQQEARRTIRTWWPASIADPKAAAILDGFAGYLQTHAIEREFDLRYLRTAYSTESRAYLGGHIIWSFPALRLSRHAVASSDRYAAVFDALERWIGISNLQGAMFEVARLPVDRLKADVIIKTISDAAGQDLSWAFDAALTDVNYAVDALSGTSVTVSRRGDGMFPGRSAPRVGARRAARSTFRGRQPSSPPISIPIASSPSIAIASITRSFHRRRPMCPSASGRHAGWSGSSTRCCRTDFLPDVRYRWSR